MAKLFTSDQLPATSADAIRVFDERYLAGVSVATPPDWTEQFGDVFDVDSPIITFPIGLLTTKYQETSGENRAQSMQERSFDVKVVEYDAGYEAKLLDLKTNVYAYKKWSETSTRFLTAEKRHLNKQIVTLLEDANQKSPWDGEAFFSATHLADPSNPDSDLFSNYQSVAADPSDITKIEAEVTAMRGVLDENGDKLGVEPDTILLPTGKFQKVFNMLSQALIVESGAGVSNPFLGKFNVVHVPELTGANDWYLVDSKMLRLQGLPPWGALRYRPADTLGLRYFDESSDFFKNTGKLKVSSHLWYGFALIFPHAIRKIVGA